MKKFLSKIILFLLLITSIVSFILVKYGGFVDYFYLKFTSPKQTSMILGDSRSFQGIQPKVINRCLKNQGYHLPMFNYSFTISQVAYGKPYRQSVQNKLDENSKNGLFILNVSPWLLAQREKDDFKKNIFEEQNQPPHNMKFVDVNPNYEYFFRNYNYFHFALNLDLD